MYQLNNINIIRFFKSMSDIVGLKLFLNTTYLWTCTSICVILLVGSITGSNNAINIKTTCGFGVLFALIGAVGVSFTKCNVFKSDYKNSPIYYSTNKLSRLMLYTLLIFGAGLLLGPIITLVQWFNILYLSLWITVGIFAGTILFVNKCKSESLLILGPIVGGCVLSLSSLSLIAFASYLLYGNIYLLSFVEIELYVGIIIYACAIAYDTHLAIGMYHNKEPDHLICSTILHVDFINLLIRIIKIFSIDKQHNNKYQQRK